MARAVGTATSIMAARMPVVDLTQPIGPQTVPWTGSEPLRSRLVSTYEEGRRVLRRIELDEHYGTHVDAPSHFHPGGRHLAFARRRAELVLPAVVRLPGGCGEDPNFAARARARSRRTSGSTARSRASSLVAACTGWDRYRDDAARYLGSPPRFPGYAPDAARLLVERSVTAIAIDTLSVDRGIDTACPVHHITSPAGVWHVEGLVGLERLPPTGATVVVGVLPLVEGSGAPARVLALVPDD